MRDRSFPEIRRSLEALAAEAEAFEAQSGAMLLVGISQEKSLLQALAWIAEEPDVDRQDLAAMRRLLPDRPIAPVVRQLLAGEASYLVVPPFRGSFSDADIAQVLDGYRRLALELEQGRRGGAVLVAGSSEPRAAPHPATVPAMILATARPSFESIVQQLAAITAARQLAQLAFDLRLAALQECAYPETLASLPLASEPDPLTGRQPRYLRDDRGGALLSNPNAAAAWDTLPRCPKTKPPPYAWRLPPPCAPSAHSSARLQDGRAPFRTR